MGRSSTTASPSSRGGGSWAASGSCWKHGEQTARGCTAEQISWTNPGRVNSADRAPPPMVGAPSYTVTAWPARASTMAAARPFGPEPMTAARGFVGFVNFVIVEEMQKKRLGNSDIELTRKERK